MENSILIMPMRKLFRILGRSDLNTDSGSIGIAIRFAIKFIVSKLYLFSSTFPYFFFSWGPFSTFPMLASLILYSMRIYSC